MKTVEIVITRTEAIRVPISVPNHWTAMHVRRELIRHPATLDDIADEIVDQGWAWGCENCLGGERLGVEEVDINPPPYDDEPVYVFPDEPAPPHPDQLALLEAA